jgi:hypothetical protein
MEGLASFAYFVDCNEFEISEIEDFGLYWILPRQSMFNLLIVP